MMWGDDRTSSTFATTPEWFLIFKIVTQILFIVLLFLPFKLRRKPNIFGIFIAICLIFSTFLATPLLDAEFILLTSSLEIALIVIFLLFLQPSVKFEQSDIRLLYFLFLGGFLLQIGLYLGLGRLPSHSLLDTFVRYNGITNDSLSTGLILPLFVPWVLETRFRALKVFGLILASVLTGSLFSAIFVPFITIVYAIYARLYLFTIGLLVGLISGIIYFYSIFAKTIEIKFLSIVTHLRFFLDLGGVMYQQPIAGCDEEFCESFVEAGLHLGPIYMILMYALLLNFIIPLMKRSGRDEGGAVALNTLRVFGLALLVGTLVHPVPLIPLAIPIFIIFATLYSASINNGPSDMTP